MANQQERSRRRYRDDEGETRQPYGNQGYEGNPFSDEDESGESDYGNRYTSQMNSPREREKGYQYDRNYRNQGYSSSSQSNTGQFDRSRDPYANQGKYGDSDWQFRDEARSQYGNEPRGPYSGQGQSGGQYGNESRSGGQYAGQYGGQYGGQSRGMNSERQGQHMGKGPKGWKRSDDRIYEEVCQVLEQRADIDPSEVEVKVSNGEVTLEGTVSDRMTKRLLDEALDSVSGVTDVHNRVRVQNNNGNSNQSQSNQRGDEMSSRTSGSSSTRSSV